MQRHSGPEEYEQEANFSYCTPQHEHLGTEHVGFFHKLIKTLVLQETPLDIFYFSSDIIHLDIG